MQQVQHLSVQKAHQRLHTLSDDEQMWIQAAEREHEPSSR